MSFKIVIGIEIIANRTETIITTLHITTFPVLEDRVIVLYTNTLLKSLGKSVNKYPPQKQAPIIKIVIKNKTKIL